MEANTIKVSEHLYDVTLQITGMVEFGIGFQDVITDPTKMPPQGARFDISFEGKMTGPKLKGTIKGIDYIYMRPDGLAKLHIHGVGTTDDGANIALFAEGVSFPTDQPGIFDLRENVSLLTAAPAYTWVNQLQVWARGSVNLDTGEIKISGYSA